MTVLTIDDNQTLQSYLKLAAHILDRLGLELMADWNLADFKKLYPKVPGHTTPPKTHDPDYCYCRPDNSFWVGFRPKGEAEMAALCAHRAIDTECLISELYTHCLWGDIGPTIDAYEFGLEDGLPQLSGCMGSNGGIVVATDWRGKRLEGWPDLRLGGLIARIAQALSIRRLRIDYQFSFTVDSPSRHKLAKSGYGMAHSVLATTGVTPINGRNMDLMLNWTSRAELLGRMQQELDRAGRRYMNASE